MQKKTAKAASLLMALSCAHASAKEYVYTNHAQLTSEGTGSYSLRFDMDKLVQRHGHSGVRFEVCKDDEPYFCIDAGSDHFAVPRNSVVKVGDTCIHKGRTFVVERERTISIWGRSESVLIITSQFSERETTRFIGRRSTDL